VILLLVALPTSYRPFISTHGHDKTLSFPITVARLLQEEDLTKPSHENGTSLAFFVNNKRKFNNNKKIGSIIFIKVERMPPHMNPRLQKTSEWWNVIIPTRKNILLQNEKPKLKIVKMEIFKSPCLNILNN